MAALIPRSSGGALHHGLRLPNPEAGDLLLKPFTRIEFLVTVVVPVMAVWALLILSPGASFTAGEVLSFGMLFTVGWSVGMWVRGKD